jgi:hypothetical protein
MTHLDEDTLLKFVLETLDEPDAALVREHLSGCQLCTQQEKKFRMEVRRLSDVEVHVEAVTPPRLPRRMRILVVASRAAAILAVGFLAGYLTAELSSSVQPIPVQQRLVPVRVATPPTGYTPCQAVDITIGRKG